MTIFALIISRAGGLMVVSCHECDVGLFLVGFFSCCIMVHDVNMMDLPQFWMVSDFCHGSSPA
jgi:hypothetical protein